MTILFFDGFDDYGSVEDMYSVYNEGTRISHNHIHPHPLGGSTGNCYGATASDISRGMYFDKILPAHSSLCASVAFYIEGGDAEYSRIMGVGTGDVIDGQYYSDGALAYLSQSNEVRLRAWPSGQEVGSGIILAKKNIYHLELEALSDGTVNLYITEALVATISRGSTSSLRRAGFAGIIPTAGTATQYRYMDHFIVSDTLVGNAFVMPMVPSADGAVGTDFTPTPDDGSKWDKVDELVQPLGGSVGHDSDSTYVQGAGPGAKQTFAVSAPVDFAEPALAYSFCSASKAPAPSPYKIQTFTTNNGNEEALPLVNPRTGTYTFQRSDVYTSLPGGLSLTQENLEATEIGVRLSN